MPNTVRETFDQLRQYLARDIHRLLMHTEGGNYAVALLVSIGSEALSRLRGCRKETVFEQLLTKHGFPSRMAKDVFNALRMGTAHICDTKYIQSGKLKIELLVSWGEKKHLTVRRDPPGLYLNVKTMWNDLHEVLEELNATLPTGGSIPKEWIRKSVEQGDPKAVADWKTWIGTHQAG